MTIFTAVISFVCLTVALNYHAMSGWANIVRMRNKLFPLSRRALSAAVSRMPLAMYPINNVVYNSSDEYVERTERCMKFLDASPEPFHCTQDISNKLVGDGFLRLQERDLWSRNSKIQKGGKYFFTRGGSSVVAFVVGSKFELGNGFKIIGAHTDSPNLKLKPNSKRVVSHGVVQLNVECYGGGLWHTWFDRDLSLAGRVVLRNPSAADGDGEVTFTKRLLKISRPVLRIPTLCIHLQSDEERKAFAVNKDEHLAPILCNAVSSILGGSSPTQTEEDSIETASSAEGYDSWRANQSPQLLELIASELQCALSDICHFDLSLYDTQGAARSGYQSEFLCSSRLDNLASCFVAVEALAHHAREGAAEDEDISVVALFDHEEVGSASVTGAGSTLIADTVERVMHAVSSQQANGGGGGGGNGGGRDVELDKLSRARSFILSVDMAHAVHPNYASKHDRAHAPLLNGGVAVKSNANQRYATSGESGFLVRELARRCAVPTQEFSVKNTCPCGSTIGPILSTHTGIRAADVGMPQLSMHSIREMMGCADLTHAATLFGAFFRDFRAVDEAFPRD